ncbi:hypothetical protein [Silvimonas soli]|uniref:hypothetical protein n=1 Tax=Silvimonas soli TaxID=2980100 RepID=UPI0024B3BC8E|nr:hypothetical protein [Silvimonas soli]
MSGNRIDDDDDDIFLGVRQELERFNARGERLSAYCQRLDITPQQMRLALEDYERMRILSRRTLDRFVDIASSIPQIVSEFEDLESKKAKRLAEKRHAPHYQLRKEAIGLYQSRNWKSMRQAAKNIRGPLERRADQLGVKLSIDNIERTIYDWIRDFEKSLRLQADVIHLPDDV